MSFVVVSSGCIWLEGTVLLLFLELHRTEIMQNRQFLGGNKVVTMLVGAADK